MAWKQRELYAGQYGDKPLIAAMTANAHTEDKETCYAAGMDEYVSKPINLELLTAALKRLSPIGELQ